MAAYKMAAVKVTPPNDFPLGLIRSHMVVIPLFLMLCDLQRVVRDLWPTLYRPSRSRVLRSVATSRVLRQMWINRYETDRYRVSNKLGNQAYDWGGLE
jgi:hypothetical protein